MGIMSEFFSPYFGDSSMDTIYPAIYSNATQMLNLTIQLGKGTRKLGFKEGQYFDELLSNTMTFYGGGAKIYRRTMNPYHKNYLRYKKIFRDFQDEHYKDKGGGMKNYERTTSTPYYENLLSAFNQDKPEEFAKEFTITLFKLASDYYNAGMASDAVGNPVGITDFDDAIKKAHSTLKSKLKTYNPNPRSWIEAFYEKGASEEKKAKALNWAQYLTKDQSNEIFKLEAEYKERLKKFKAMYPTYLRKMNLADMAKEFEWVQKAR